MQFFCSKESTYENNLNILGNLSIQNSFILPNQAKQNIIGSIYYTNIR